MKAKGWVCITAFFIMIALFGCQAQSPASPRIVASVTVNWDREGHSFTRHYTDTEKMEAVLEYLRLLKTEQPAEAVFEYPEDASYCITVSLLDGTAHTYRQQQHRFFRREQMPWQEISPAQAAQLYGVLRQNKSDL